MIPQPVTSEPITLLPRSELERVITFFDQCLSNDTFTPGGKKEFFQGAVNRDGFLPKDLQAQIDANRGSMPRADYLSKHLAFGGKYDQYRG